MSVYLYAGSFSPNGEGGYSIYSFDQESGDYQAVETYVFPEICAGVMCFDPRRNILYATDERACNPLFSRAGGGRVFAFKADPSSGRLRKINDTLSYGARPSFAATDREGKYLIVTNFGASKHAPQAVSKVVRDTNGDIRIELCFDAATTVLYRIADDGSIGEVLDVIEHPEEGYPDPVIPHVHCVKLSPDGSLFAVSDMGNDQIYMFRIDEKAEKLVLPAGQPYECEKGYGPRYLCFHPVKPWLFFNTEDIPTVAALSYDQDGHLSEIDSVDVMPEGFEPSPELQSGLTLSADGRFLYSAMRKFDIINVLSVDQESGRLSRIQTFKLRGKHPKDCAVSPDGRWLAVANRRSDDVEILRISREGTLSSSGISVPMKAAGNVFFIEF